MIGNIVAGILGVIAVAAVVWSFWYDNRGVEDTESEIKSKKDKE